MLSTTQLTASRPYKIGDIVRVVDTQESPSEWAKFEIKALGSATYQIKPLDRSFLCDNQNLFVIAGEIIPDDSISNISPLSNYYQAGAFLDALFDGKHNDFTTVDEPFLIEQIKANFDSEFSYGEIGKPHSFHYYINEEEESNLLILQRFPL